jgi:hypothetical protein
MSIFFALFLCLALSASNTHSNFGLDSLTFANKSISPPSPSKKNRWRRNLIIIGCFVVIAVAAAVYYSHYHHKKPLPSPHVLPMKEKEQPVTAHHIEADNRHLQLLLSKDLIENIGGIYRLKDLTKPLPEGDTILSQDVNFNNSLAGGTRFSFISRNIAFNKGWTFDSNTDTWIPPPE